jgi:hypothetical protein
VISARDEIWIDMMQFDVRAADRLWEGVAPAQGAPGWYDDVSGLIETANGPAEPHELVDEPIVVDDMHRTTLGRSPSRCRRGRTVGRVIALKTAAATTASVLGLAAAAAATTGIVATVAAVVVPVIEEHVLPVEEDKHEPATPAATPPAPAGGPDTGLDDQSMDLAGASPAIPAPAPSPQPTPSEPAAEHLTSAPSAPAVEAVADVAPSPQPAALEPVATHPIPPTDPSHVKSAPHDPPSAEPRHPAKGPPADTAPAKLVAPRDTPASPDASHRDSGSGRTHKGGRKAERNAAVGEPAAEGAERRWPAHSRRPG